MKIHKIIQLQCIRTAVTLLLLQVGTAQVNTGSIAGTVADPAGAVAPAATVIATNAQTGGTFQTISSSAGLYVFPSLPMGRFELNVEKTGFKKPTRAGLEACAAARLAVDLQLEVGDVQQTVEERQPRRCSKRQPASGSTTFPPN